MGDNAVATWDFTITAASFTAQQVQKGLNQLFKKYVFQKENSASGYIHFQGRGSLRKKARMATLKSDFAKAGLAGAHLSPSSNNSQEGQKTFSYVMKVDTRIDGPWSDKDAQEAAYIPRQYRDLENCLYPWQKTVWDSSESFDKRYINCVVDPEGNHGKSTIASLVELHGRGIDLPPINDAEKLIQSVCDILVSKECREPKILFVDMPRAMNKSRLAGMYTAIEQLKKGKVYDTRYKYQSWWFDSPQIWVFTNHVPDVQYLSKDRWKIFNILNNELVPVVPGS